MPLETSDSGQPPTLKSLSEILHRSLLQSKITTVL